MHHWNGEDHTHWTQPNDHFLKLFRVYSLYIFPRLNVLQFKGPRSPCTIFCPIFNRSQFFIIIHSPHCFQPVHN
ncbi:DUF723 domain-containing protein [Desulforhopalus sp. 52FAK]